MTIAHTDECRWTRSKLHPDDLDHYRCVCPEAGEEARIVVGQIENGAITRDASPQPGADALAEIIDTHPEFLRVKPRDNTFAICAVIACASALVFGIIGFELGALSPSPSCVSIRGTQQ